MQLRPELADAGVSAICDFSIQRNSTFWIAAEICTGRSSLHTSGAQWWADVGFRGYRDQWMSEGFADTSASIFLQATRPKRPSFLSSGRAAQADYEKRLRLPAHRCGSGDHGLPLMSPKAVGISTRTSFIPRAPTFCTCADDDGRRRTEMRVSSHHARLS